MSATYTLTPAGDITFQTVSRGVVTQTITVDSDDNLGLFFDTEDGVLHKHGPAQAVSDNARQIRATYAYADSPRSIYCFIATSPHIRNSTRQNSSIRDSTPT